MDDYIIYKIKKEDTLESIAKAHNTTVAELLRFHNSHCGVTRFICKEQWPPYFSDIYVVNPEANMRLINPLPQVSPYVSDFVYRMQESHEYEINIKTAVVFLGSKISNKETMLHWLLDFNMPQHGYLNRKEILRKSVKEFPHISLVDTLLDAMNDATNNLFFQLNIKGGIETVMNNYEVQKRWKAIKMERLKTLELNIPELTVMFRLCDEEFANLHASLQQNLLYNLFFLPVGKTSISHSEAFVHLSEHKVLSQFFQPLFIPYSLHYRRVKEDNDFTQVHLISKTNKKQTALQFEKSFKEKYAAISQMPLDFDYNIEGYYSYHDTGLLQQSKVFVRELVNQNCFYTAEYEFKLMNS